MTGISRFFALLAVGIALAGPARAEQVLRIAGTGAGLAAMRLLAEASPARAEGTRIEVLPSLGSGGGMRALGEGAVEVAIVGRSLTEQERASGTLEALCWTTPVVFLTSHPAPSGLALAEIPAIYRSARPSWRDGAALRIILRSKVDADTAYLAERLPGMQEAFEAARRRPDIPVATTDQDNFELAPRIAGSLTTGTLVQYLAEKPDLRLVPVDGVVPSIDSFASGDYPLGKPMCLVASPQAPPQAASFTRFLRSQGAAPLLRRLALFPERAD
jgi:phosphate transport system substrate-binding protein